MDMFLGRTTSFLQCRLHLAQLHGNQAVTRLLCLHQLVPVEVTDLSALLSVFYLLCPSRIIPLLRDPGFLPGFTHGALPSRMAYLDDMLCEVQLLEGDGFPCIPEQ